MDLLGLLPIVLIGVVFYLLIMRPARNRQKQQQALLAALAPGTAVMTTAGVYGTIVEIDGEDVRLEVAPGVVLRMVKPAIAKVIDESDRSDASDSDASSGESDGATEDSSRRDA